MNEGSLSGASIRRLDDQNGRKAEIGRSLLSVEADILNGTAEGFDAKQMMVTLHLGNEFGQGFLDEPVSLQSDTDRRGS